MELTANVRYFTVEEANRTLPLVERVVADITAEYSVWRELVRRYELVAASATAADGESSDQPELHREIELVAARVNGYLEELGQIGCLFKSFEEGLVDFHGQLEGRDVLWCWRLGEPRIEHWHEIEAGYAGRQPLPAEVER